MQKDTNNMDRLRFSESEIYEKTNKVASPVLRARCFPRSQSLHASTLSRSSTPADILRLRSSESINEQLCMSTSSPTQPAANADAYMTVCYPPTNPTANEGGLTEKAQYRPDSVRTQVRVEGYFQHEDDALGILIPNDLPRSRILYVLTASEGRDKLFKCLQFGSQAIICLIKDPRLISPDVQVHAGRWAERLLRNGNTIRHGRSLFKLGRWIMNIYYFLEVWERLALKHGSAASEMLRSVRASLRRLLPWRSASEDSTPQGIEPAPATHGLSSTPGPLPTGDMYKHIARVECPRQEDLFQPPFFSKRSSMYEKDNEADGVLRPLLANEMVNSNSLDALSQQDDPLLKQYLKVRKQSMEVLQKEQNLKSQPQQQGQVNEKGVEGIDEARSAVSLLSSPPSVQLTLPATLEMGAERGKKNSRLLQPLCRITSEEVQLEAPASREPGTLERSTNETVQLEDAEHVLDPYQPQNIATRIECTSSNAFTPGSFSSRAAAIGSSNIHSLQGNNNGQPVNDEVNMGFFQNNLYQQSTQEFTGNDAGAMQYGVLNNSDVSINSSTTESSKEERDEEHLIPAEKAYPINWRKKVLDFSTPLMLLLGIRSLATIGRRFIRDILLLTSKRFLNFVCVEENRLYIQQRANWLWLIVACIDLLLNTIRLTNSGWYKYATVGQNEHCRCACIAENSRDKLWRSRGFLAWSKTNLVFPPLDLDFGAPLVSSPGYFESAAPEHMAPMCKTCGYLYVETREEEGAFGSPRQHEWSREEWQARTRRPTGNEKGRDVNAESLRDIVRTASKSGLSLAERADVAILFIPWLLRRIFNYMWLIRTHPNLTETLILQIRYMAEMYLAFKYCLGGYETGKCDAPLEAMLHPCGAAAGLIGALISLHRVIESAPK